jgi:DNA repair protein RecO (recombination protein O)
MLHHSRGIVLNYIKFRESSIIVRVFTEAFGMQSYIVNGARSSRSRGKIALYQPLTLLDMVVYHKPSKDIQRISEAKCSYPFGSIPFHPVKTGISIFITEVLTKLLREEAENPDLFNFMFQAIQVFDHITEGISNFHLQFLLKSSAYLGFKPASANDFLLQLSDYGLHLTTEEEERKVIDEFLSQPLGAPLKISNVFRRELLTHILRFYQLHTNALREIKSLEILKEVLS